MLGYSNVNAHHRFVGVLPVDPRVEDRLAGAVDSNAAGPRTAAHVFLFLISKLVEIAHARQRLAEVLAQAGSLGWELVSVHDRASNWFGGPEQGFLLLKRQIPGGIWGSASAGSKVAHESTASFVRRIHSNTWPNAGVCDYTWGCNSSWMGAQDGCDCNADGSICGADTDCGGNP